MAGRHSDAGSSLAQTVVAVASVALIIKGLSSMGVSFLNLDSLGRQVSRAGGSVQSRIGQGLELVFNSEDSVTIASWLLLLLVLSALGTAMLVLSRSKSSSGARERLVSQARKGAEAGAHKAANFLLHSYDAPGTASDPLENYDTTVSPVTYVGKPVVLSTLSEVKTNYPLEAVRTGFAAAVQGKLTSGRTTVLHSASATLLSMGSITPYGAAASTVVQTWRLTARGALLGARRADVEVETEIGRQVVPTYKYGLFATQDVCGALEFSGGVRVNSYDSSNMTRASGMPRCDDWGGHVGTNGNLAESGGSIIYGSLSTPLRGAGNCLEDPVTSFDSDGTNPVSGNLIEFAQPVTIEPPDLPSPLPPKTPLVISRSSTDADVPIRSGTCRVTYPLPDASVITLDPQGTPMALGNLQLTADSVLVLEAGVYNINSIKLTGKSILRIGSGPVILNVAGVDQRIPVDLEGGTVTNTSFDPSNFRILYAGTGVLKLTDGVTLTASVYAPLSDTRIAGGADFFGAVVAARITISDGAKCHYDRRLNEHVRVGPPTMAAFKWREY